MAAAYDLATSLIRRLYDSRISGTPVLDSSVFFPNEGAFRRDWQAIRDEALGIAARLQQVPRFHELLPSQRDISTQDQRDWRMFVLKAYGVPVEKNLAQCPALATLLRQSPDVLSATFSFLDPHKHIPRHRGPFRGIVRYYLGLSVATDPDGRPSALLSLDGQEHRIGNGEALLWDDTYPHEVWNNSDQVRIALLLDIRRNHLPPDLAILSRLIIFLVGVMARLKVG